MTHLRYFILIDENGDKLVLTPGGNIPTELYDSTGKNLDLTDLSNVPVELFDSTGKNVDLTDLSNVPVELMDSNGLNLDLTTESNVPVAIKDSNGLELELETDGSIPITPKHDWFQMVAEGYFTNYSSIEKFGENPVITTATDPEDVWDGGGIYTFSTTANIDSVSSSDNTDTQDIYVSGLDANWEEVNQTVTLTGQTTATLGTPLLRVYRMINMGTTDIAGIMYCYINGATVASGVPTTAIEIRAVINNGNNQTLMCIYTVPAGKTGYFWAGYVSISRGGGVSAAADFTWRARLDGGVFSVKSRISAVTGGNSSWNYTYKIPLVLPEKTDVLIRCEEVSATVGVSGGFTVLLKDN